jgi:hypothetical protein
VSLFGIVETNLHNKYILIKIKEKKRRKYPTYKRSGGVTQVLEHLPSKPESLSSNPNVAKKQLQQKPITLSFPQE